MYVAHICFSPMLLLLRAEISYMHCSNLTVVRLPEPQERKEVMIVSWVLSKIRNYLQYRETVTELSRLTDRELDDLGITRFDIESIARNSGAR
jgi:uncharacterized protein YjiS (DUF1127 family)